MRPGIVTWVYGAGATVGATQASPVLIRHECSWQPYLQDVPGRLGRRAMQASPPHAVVIATTAIALSVSYGKTRSRQQLLNGKLSGRMSSGRLAKGSSQS
jgi:hypothetical protein